MILKRIFTLTLIVIMVAIQCYGQQKIEMTTPGHSIPEVDLRLKQQVYDKFSKYENSPSTKIPHQAATNQHSFDLNQAVWQHGLEKVLDHNGNVIAVRGKIDGVKELKSLKSRINTYVGHLTGIYNIKNATDELSIMASNTDHQGHIHTRLQQNFSGIEIYGGDMIVHENADHDIYLIQGSAIDIDRDLETEPKFSNAEIHKLAITYTTNYIPFPQSIEGLMTLENILCRREEHINLSRRYLSESRQ